MRPHEYRLETPLVVLFLVASMTTSCTRYECEPDCQDRSCGDDGCGGVCGECEDTTDPCLETSCDDGQCTDVSRERGTSCPIDNECATGECVDGECTEVPKEDGTSCSGSGRDCNEGECEGGECVDVMVENGPIVCDSSQMALEGCWDGEVDLWGCGWTCEQDGYDATGGCDIGASTCNCDNVDEDCRAGERICYGSSRTAECYSADDFGTDDNFFHIANCADTCADNDEYSVGCEVDPRDDIAYCWCAAAGNSVMIFQLTDSCTTDGSGFTVQLYLRSGASWASQYVSNGESTTLAIECEQGTEVCYGAWRGDDYYWGCGENCDQTCNSTCCYTCGDSIEAVSLRLNC